MEENFFDALRDAIRNSDASQAEIARQTGTQQASISRFLAGVQGLNAETALKISGFLGGKMTFPCDSARTLPVMRRTGAYSPSETVQGDELPTIPVLGEAGAGPDIEIFTGETEKTIPILPGYYRHGMWAVRVAGDSMSPLICRGAYVGVVPLDDLEDGGIYLVRKPPFGYIVKRVRMDEQGQIVLHSENPEYKPQTVPYEGYEDIIVGHVIWWWQLA